MTEPFDLSAAAERRLWRLCTSSSSPGAAPRPTAKRGNIHLSCLDIRTGELLDRQRTEAGYALDHREPEGLAVRRGSEPRLCLGLASGPEGARRFSLHYKPHTG
ncbi:hypothetical protein [Streptomyces sp. NPDC057740]|uniref:hypothetical protein n=1 Tax=Streptomyces sp. NPDC057740 TaxID=3346234 RepID=UPI0036B32CC2